MKLLKAAIHGMGFMGKTHYDNLLKIEGVKIVAVCDVNHEKMDHKINHTINTYTNFDEMLDIETLDLLVICLPPFAHNGEFEKAAEKGIHIFIEKPISLNTISGKIMCDAALRNGIITQVGYHQRFGGAVTKLKEYINADLTGKACLFDGHYACNSLHAPWWREKVKCGSQILEQVIHTYDMSMYLFGLPIAVTGMIGNVCHQDVENYTIEDVSSAIIKYENSALGSICATNCAVPDHWDNPFQVIYENMVARFKDPNNAEFIFTKEDRIEHINTDVDMYFEEMLSFVKSIIDKKQTVCNIIDGYKSLMLVETVMNSALENGKLKENMIGMENF